MLSAALIAVQQSLIDETSGKKPREVRISERNCTLLDTMLHEDRHRSCEVRLNMEAPEQSAMTRCACEVGQGKRHCCFYQRKATQITSMVVDCGNLGDSREAYERVVAELHEAREETRGVRETLQRETQRLREERDMEMMEKVELGREKAMMELRLECEKEKMATEHEALLVEVKRRNEETRVIQRAMMEARDTYEAGARAIGEELCEVLVLQSALTREHEVVKARARVAELVARKSAVGMQTAVARMTRGKRIGKMKR